MFETLDLARGYTKDVIYVLGSIVFEEPCLQIFCRHVLSLAFYCMGDTG
jgi:hypothetical protein